MMSKMAKELFPFTFRTFHAANVTAWSNLNMGLSYIGVIMNMDNLVTENEAL
jgi:hypothetical protein